MKKQEFIKELSENILIEYAEDILLGATKEHIKDMVLANESITSLSSNCHLLSKGIERAFNQVELDTIYEVDVLDKDNKVELSQVFFSEEQAREFIKNDLEDEIAGNIEDVKVILSKGLSEDGIHTHYLNEIE